MNKEKANVYHFIHERGDCPLLAMEDISIVWSKYLKKIVGYNESPVFFIYQNGWCRVYSYEKVHRKAAQYVFHKINQDKQFVANVRQMFDKKAKIFLDFVNQIEKYTLSKVSAGEIINLRRSYAHLYHDLAPYGEPLPYFLKEKLEQELTSYFLKKGVPTADYEILIASSYQSFLNRETTELWGIFQAQKSGRDVTKRLKKHQQQYRWLLFDYASITAGTEYFTSRMEEFKHHSPVLTDYITLKQQKEQIKNQHHIDKHYRYYLDILDELYYLMDKKKEVLTQGHMAMALLHQELARRFKVDLETMRWFLWEELEKYLINGTRPDLNIAKERKALSTIEYIDGIPQFMTHKQIQTRLMVIAAQESELIKSNEIRGMPASPGKVTGMVRYLKSAQENDQIQPGEILVVSSTTPDFMPAIVLARAIVTNEGGITSHAAIVSRELKIPCVVGTKIATQALHTGDLVHVDANNGMVKILQKNKQ